VPFYAILLLREKAPYVFVALVEADGKVTRVLVDGKTGAAKVEKMPNDVVRITMTNQTAFDTDSIQVKPGFYTTMDKLADVVVRYNKTSLTVVGHTDNAGSDSYNQKLSEQRALSVARYLEGKRVHPMRLATSGKGESQPVASNSSDSGRQANRRVEIYVEPVTQG
jgi:outer membrane protein OmpA-like peptidoglycan-associated protein